MTTTFSSKTPRSPHFVDYLSWIRARLTKSKNFLDGFVFSGRRFNYLMHPYNRTWTNERVVEVPVVMDVVRRYPNGRILEFGNVLSHYNSFPHDIVDKYESGPGVINEDIVSYQPTQPYDLIVSISTLEHVGWDEHPRDMGKMARALAHLKGCLKPGGYLYMSAPLGYNPEHDQILEKNPGLFDKMTFLKRVDKENHWKEVSASEGWGARYNDPFPAANVIIICEWTKPGGNR